MRVLDDGRRRRRPSGAASHRPGRGCWAATVGSVRELWTSRDLLANLTLRELRGKYKRSVLGWVWSLLNPLATMMIFTLVFGVFLKVDGAAGRPQRPRRLRPLPAVRAPALELPGQRHDRRHGHHAGQRQPDQEGVLPPPDPRRGQRGLVGGVLPHRARRAGRRPAHRRQHRAPVAGAGGGPGAGAVGRSCSASAWPWACSTCTSATSSTSSASCCRSGSTPRPIVYPVTLVPRTATLLGRRDPGAVPLRPEPDGALRRRLPRPPLRRAGPGGRRARSTCWSCPWSPSSLGLVVFARLEPKLAEEL